MADELKPVANTNGTVKLSNKEVKSFKGKTVKEIRNIFPTAHVMDFNENGVFDIGDTIDLENTSEGKIKSYHLVKKGEAFGIAGEVDTAEFNARKRFTQRMNSKTFNKIKKTYMPTMESFNDVDKNGVFSPGDTITEKLPNGGLRKYYFVKSGDLPSIVHKKVLGNNTNERTIEDLYKQNHTNGDIYFDVDKVIIYDY